MASHRIVFTPEARDQFDSLHAYITTVADADIVSRFVDGIIDHVATLTDFPDRGTPRDDIRAGLRTIPWRRRVTIAFMAEVEGAALGVFPLVIESKGFPSV